MFFSQTVDYTALSVTNYFYYPGQATSSVNTGVTKQTLPLSAGTSDIILDTDLLYIGGATNAPKSCGTFQRIFVSPTTSTATIPDIDVLRFGYAGTLLPFPKGCLKIIYVGINYLAFFQFNEFKGQKASSSLDTNYYFLFGSNTAKDDPNDPHWDKVIILLRL